MCAQFGYAELSRNLNDELRCWLLPQAVITGQPFALMTALMDELRRRRILILSIQVLERLVAAVRLQANQYTYHLLDMALGNQREQTDALLRPQDGQAISRYAWLKQQVGLVTLSQTSRIRASERNAASHAASACRSAANRRWKAVWTASSSASARTHSSPLHMAAE